MKALLLASVISAVGYSQIDIESLQRQVKQPYCEHYRQLEAFDQGQFNNPEAYSDIHKICG